MSARSGDAGRRIVRGLKAAGLAGVLAVSALGSAEAATRIGWLWADQPATAGPYTPDPSYSFNSVGGAVSVTRLAKGVYRASFGGLSSLDPSNVLVTAYDFNGWCNSFGWGGDGDTVLATVNCFNYKGNPADAQFTLVYQSHSGTFGDAEKGTGFVWAGNPGTTDYTPDSAYSYNSTGGTNTVHRALTGNYEVTLPGFDLVGGTVQVTAYGPSANRCKVGGWGVHEGGTTIAVICFDKTGAAADTPYELVYSRNVPVAYKSLATTTGAYAWAQRRRPAVTYKPSKIYQYNNMSVGKLTAGRYDKGRYHVDIPGSPSFSSSNVLVTAEGFNNTYCNVVGWYPIDVDCFRQGGQRIDAQFDVATQVTP
jgi:hypothetical protein